MKVRSSLTAANNWILTPENPKDEWARTLMQLIGDWGATLRSTYIRWTPLWPVLMSLSSEAHMAAIGTVATFGGAGLLTSSLVAVRGMVRSLHSNFGFVPQNAMQVNTDLEMGGYKADQVSVMQRC